MKHRRPHGHLARALILAVTAAALLAPAGSAEAAGFSYAYAGAPTVAPDAPGTYQAALHAVASVDGPLVVDIVAADGTTVTTTSVTGVGDAACTVTGATAVHCRFDAAAGVAVTAELTGAYATDVVHLRTSATDAAGPVSYAGDTTYHTVPATGLIPPVLPTPITPTPAPGMPVLTLPPVTGPTPAALAPQPRELTPLGRPATSRTASHPTTTAGSGHWPDAAMLAQLRGKVLMWTNAARAANGLAPLHLSTKLDQSAQSYATHLAGDGAFSHTDGSVLDTRIAATGYRYHWIGENLGLGQSSPWSIVHAWMQSPEHRTNMLDKRFTDAGIGIVKRHDGQIIWCLDFGWPR